MPSRSARSHNRPLRIGYLPLTDAAPIIAAARLGIFARHGVQVELKREVGWATIREKVRLGELEAAQGPAPMLWAMQLGLGCPPCPVLSAFVLNMNGNALTLARALGDQARSPSGFREIVRSRKALRPVTIGAVFPYSSHFLLIREWLRHWGLDIDKDVKIAVVPPGQMYRNLVAGTIDGYASGEPWNSLAVREGVGWCPLWSSALGRPQVEKVLLVTQKFAESQAPEHGALIRALAESAEWCDQAGNRTRLARILAEPAHLNLPLELIEPTLLGRFDAGMGSIERVPDFHVFHAGAANRPSATVAAKLQSDLQGAGLIPQKADRSLPERLFREDIYEAALAQKGPIRPPNATLKPKAR
jgi:ABC-type nitrate/sulfonate/bicarbonate transport system substrate-binding protein